MNEKEFDFLLKQGEGLKLECKESFDSKNFSKELVAFANSEGGRIFVGVTDTGEIREFFNKEVNDFVLAVAKLKSSTIATFEFLA